MYVFGSGWCGRWGGLVDKRFGFGLHQSCGNMESVGHVSVFGLWWCAWYRW